MTSYFEGRYAGRSNATQESYVRISSGTSSEPRAPSQPFVGRRGCLQQLHALREHAARGAGRSALIRGEPGIGKTRLLRHFADEVRAQGARVWLAHGRCDPGAPPLWPFIQLVRALLALPEHEAHEADALAPLAAAFRPWVAQSARMQAPTAQPPESRFQLFDAIVQALLAAARQRPLCVALEDLHELDASSLSLLACLLRELHTAPLLVVLTSRDARVDASSEVGAMVDATLELRGLAVDEVRELLDASLDADVARVTATRVHARTEGNPLYVAALTPMLAALEPRATLDALSTLQIALPPSLQLAVSRRLEGLPEPCLRVLRAAAVLGREYDAELLAQLPIGDLGGDAGPDTLERWLIRACSEGILQRLPVSGARYRFTHALLCDALLAQLDAAALQGLHAAAAALLERLRQADDQAPLARIARHWLAAGDSLSNARALSFAQQAARAAEQRCAHSEAVEAYAIALEAQARGEASPDAGRAQRAELLLSMAAALWRCGDGAQARTLLPEVAAIARALSDNSLLARAALGSVGTSSSIELPSEQLPLCEEACRALADGTEPMRVRLLAHLGMRLCFSAERARGLALVAQAAALVSDACDPDTRITVLAARFVVALGRGDLAQRAALLTELAELARRVGHEEAYRLALRWQIALAAEAGDGAALEAANAVFAVAARKSCDPRELWQASRAACAQALLAGRFSEAEALAYEAFAHASRASMDDTATIYVVQLLGIRRMQGRAGELVETLQRAAERFPHVQAYRAALAAIYAELERYTEAKAELERAASDLDALAGHWALDPLCDVAYACRELGDVERARAVYALLAPFEDRCAVVGTGVTYAGPVAHALGLAAAAAGEPQRAAACFEGAIAISSRMSAPAWLARTQYELARVLSSTDRPRALALAREALSVFERLGMGGLAARAQRLLAELPEPSHAPRQLPADDNCFQREGDVWTLAYRGTGLRLRDSRGMQYLARLLARPSEEVHVLDLIAELTGTVTPQAAHAEHGASLVRAGSGWSERPIDAEAATAYRARARALREALHEAEAMCDLGRREAVQTELDALEQQLSAQLRPRHAPTERARKAVSNRIREALTRIGREHRALGDHLELSIKTGTVCAYRPEQALRWRTTW